MTTDQRSRTNLSYLVPDIIRAKSVIHGLGIFAMRPISEGQIVFVKGGGIVPLEELILMETKLACLFLPIHDNFFIGPLSNEDIGESTVYANHSCSPNLLQKSPLIFAAKHDVDVGEELCYDYRLLPAVIESFSCRCATPNCAGFIVKTV